MYGGQEGELILGSKAGEGGGGGRGTKSKRREGGKLDTRVWPGMSLVE